MTRYALLLATGLIAVASGWYVVLALIFLSALIAIWLRVKHPRKWKGSDYSVRLRGGREAWIEYEERGRRLYLRAEWDTKGQTDIYILVEQQEYLVPDFDHPLSESQLTRIQSRISEGLKHLHIRHEFVRLPQPGWTSFEVR